MSDEALALSILRKIAADKFACIYAEDYSILIDSGYVGITAEEADLIQRLVSESDPPVVKADVHYDGPATIVIPWAKR